MGVRIGSLELMIPGRTAKSAPCAAALLMNVAALLKLCSGSRGWGWVSMTSILGSEYEVYFGIELDDSYFYDWPHD